MLTVMCPNCRHRFPAPAPDYREPSEGASRQKDEEEEEEEEEKKKKNEEKEKEEEKETKKKKLANTVHPAAATSYVGGLLVPSRYTSCCTGGCFINVPTIHGPVVFQTDTAHCGSIDEIINSKMVDHEPPRLSDDVKASLLEQNHHPFVSSRTDSWNDPVPVIVSTEKFGCDDMISSNQSIATTCALTDGSITITTTPGMQSGGCLIQRTGGILMQQAPRVEIRPKLTGGGCLLQQRLSVEDEQLATSRYIAEDVTLVSNNIHQTLVVPSSGCSELPGSRRTLSFRTTMEHSGTMNTASRQRKISSSIKLNEDYRDCNIENSYGQRHEQSFNAIPTDNRDAMTLQPVGGGVQIQVNATVQLPASLGQCRVNITATTATLPTNEVITEPRARISFNGGGIVNSVSESDFMTNSDPMQQFYTANDVNSEETDSVPTTPVSWLRPPRFWTQDLAENDINRLSEVKRTLQTCGWYHEGISWQQSEKLLKHTPVGRWLMRDSSDKRYHFAVSVQTSRGLTSIRIHYFFQKFRLDADPRLALAMPLFDCPIRMLEHYVDYSKRIDEHRREVLVDHSGQLYSQIYLTKPLIKEVRSLSHLARITVNRNKLPTEHLPLLIRNYLAEYPYTL